MILIDGTQSELAINDFENLEQIFTQVMESGTLADRVVTEVYLNKEPFSEIYPHQAEDVEVEDIKEVEIKSIPVVQMASEVTAELYKVVKLMIKGGKEVATLFRQADDSEALETYQDLLDVIRHFVMMIGILRDEYSLKDYPEFIQAGEEMSDLFTEMTEVIEGEDWILLADILEYEFLPAASKWEKVITQLEKDIAQISQQ